MDRRDLNKIEADLLLEAIHRRYGYDFRSYSRASIQRRLEEFMIANGIPSASEMIPRVLHDEVFFSRLFGKFSIPVTEIFRDPFVYLAIRKKVVPMLRTWPHIKVWIAGCATGEEAYSLAIVLKEENLYDRSTIYATDFNEEALGQAREGSYGIKKMKDATKNYQLSGGRAFFSDYYHADCKAAVMEKSLKERIVFSNHNLSSDSAFGETHLVFCRNVLIYFNRELKERVLQIFDNSLVMGGLLCLGTRETLQFTEAEKRFSAVDAESRIFQKKEVP